MTSNARNKKVMRELLRRHGQTHAAEAHIHLKDPPAAVPDTRTRTSAQRQDPRLCCGLHVTVAVRGGLEGSETYDRGHLVAARR